jgi:hypothetical protein
MIDKRAAAARLRVRLVDGSLSRGASSPLPPSVCLRVLLTPGDCLFCSGTRMSAVVGAAHASSAAHAATTNFFIATSEEEEEKRKRESGGAKGDGPLGQQRLRKFLKMTTSNGKSIKTSCSYSAHCAL